MTVTAPTPAQHPAATAARALSNMHRYTTISMVSIVVFYTLVSMSQATHPALQLAMVLTAVPVAALGFFWDRRGPAWLTAVALVCASLVWWATLLLKSWPTSVLLVCVVVAVVLTQTSRTRWLSWLVGYLYVLVPVGVAALVSPSTYWFSYVFTSALAYVISLGVFVLNRYGWNLYLAIDDARRVGAELARHPGAHPARAQTQNAAR
jgi:two-component system sensor histidine kinase DesK